MLTHLATEVAGTKLERHKNKSKSPPTFYNPIPSGVKIHGENADLDCKGRKSGHAETAAGFAGPDFQQSNNKIGYSNPMARKERFPLTSDQVELLLAFEKTGGLGRLSEVMAKDPSVVSRNLQRLGELLPVIAKKNGKWRITALGKQVNELTRPYLLELERLISLAKDSQGLQREKRPCLSKNALLVVVNAQDGLHLSQQGSRNNLSAEDHIGKLLAHWRAGSRPVAHVKHVSDNPKSLFYKQGKGVGFIRLSPKAGEAVFEKSKASAFTSADFSAYAEENEFDALILTGFTAGECIDTTARQASELGFTTYVVSDATATFDVTGPDGSLYEAERVHKLVLANLHSFFAEIVDTAYLLDP